MPPDVVKSKCTAYLRAEKPTHRPAMLDDDDFTIIERYQQAYRGIVHYYLLAQDVSWFWRLHWVAKRSLLKTLAYKHQTSMMFQVQKYKASFQAEDGTLYTCLEIRVQREGKKPLVARFGAIPLKRRSIVTIVDHLPLYRRSERTELVKRLLADPCELCGSRENVEVYHVHKLADLEKRKKERPWWFVTSVTELSTQDSPGDREPEKHLGMNNWKAQCGESRTLRLAEGPTEKGCNRSTSLAAYSTT